MARTTGQGPDPPLRGRVSATAARPTRFRDGGPVYRIPPGSGRSLVPGASDGGRPTGDVGPARGAGAGVRGRRHLPRRPLGERALLAARGPVAVARALPDRGHTAAL